MIAAVILAAAIAHPSLCPDDGRLKGVRIGSAQFHAIVSALPEHSCIAKGPNGSFLVTPDNVRRISR